MLCKLVIDKILPCSPAIHVTEHFANGRGITKYLSEGNSSITFPRSRRSNAILHIDSFATGCHKLSYGKFLFLSSFTIVEIEHIAPVKAFLRPLMKVHHLCHSSRDTTRLTMFACNGGTQQIIRTPLPPLGTKQRRDVCTLCMEHKTQKKKENGE